MAEQADDVVEYWSSRPRPAWQVVGVTVLGAAVVLGVHYGPVRADIETRLTSASEQALGAAGLQGVAVSFSGRDARLSGDPAALPAALDVVATVRGVRVARTDPGRAPAVATTATDSATATEIETATEIATQIETITVPAELAAQLDELDPITFDEQSAILSDEAVSVVGQAAGLINELGTPARFIVAAHTDSLGSMEQNVIVSQLRADAVVAALVEAGVEPGRLDAVGYGEQRPAVSPEVTPADREANRRVEILPLP